MALVGVSNFHYAILKSDTETGVDYDAPKSVPRSTITIDVKPNSNTGTLYADNGPVETATALGDIDVTLDLKELSLDVQADLLGHTVENGIIVRKASDTTPYVAILFEGKKSNGKKKFIKLLKGMFQEPEENYQTANNNVNFQSGKITGKFVIREYDGAWERAADQEATGYVDTIGTHWYDSVETEAVKGTNTYTVTTNAVSGDTVTIGGTKLTAGTDFTAGDDAAGTAAALAAALNADAAFSAKYAATVSDAVITVTEITAAGHTPGTAVATGTIVITSGTATESQIAA